MAHQLVHAILLGRRRPGHQSNLTRGVGRDGILLAIRRDEIRASARIDRDDNA